MPTTLAPGNTPEIEATCQSTAATCRYEILILSESNKFSLGSVNMKEHAYNKFQLLGKYFLSILAQFNQVSNETLPISNSRPLSTVEQQFIRKTWK